MERFDSRLGAVELTDERLKHILAFHPEVRKQVKSFAKVLSKPEIIRRSKFDPTVLICYGRVSRNQFLAMVVKTNRRNFVLTAYLTNKIQHQAL